MQIKVSSKGQIVLPVAIRKTLQIHEGDTLETKVEDDHILLFPSRPRKFRTWIGKSPKTGLPVMMTKKGAPKITSKMVAKLLEDFP